MVEETAGYRLGGRPGQLLRLGRDLAPFVDQVDHRVDLGAEEEQRLLARGADFDDEEVGRLSVLLEQPQQFVAGQPDPFPPRASAVADRVETVVEPLQLRFEAMQEAGREIAVLPLEELSVDLRPLAERLLRYRGEAALEAEVYEGAVDALAPLSGPVIPWLSSAHLVASFSPIYGRNTKMIASGSSVSIRSTSPTISRW